MDPSIHRIPSAELGPITRSVDRAPPVGADRAESTAHPAKGTEGPSPAVGEQVSDVPLDPSDLVPYEILRDEALLASERGWRAALLSALLQVGAEQGRPEEGGAHNAAGTSPKFPPAAELHEAHSGLVESNLAGTQRGFGALKPSFMASSGASEGEEPLYPAAKLYDVGAPDAEMLKVSVTHLWSVMRELAQSTERHTLVRLRECPSSPLVSFASMGREWLEQGLGPADRMRLVQWVMMDRLIASVTPHPFDRRGSGLFLVPHSNAREHPVAVRWRAERRTRMGSRGKLVHRLRLDLELDGHALACVLTAQRPALHVHITCSPDAPFVKYLQAAGQHVAPSLEACGWELTSWTVDHEGEGSDATS